MWKIKHYTPTPEVIRKYENIKKHIASPFVCFVYVNIVLYFLYGVRVIFNW